jgi:SAM-dependent methyltransferase
MNNSFSTEAADFDRYAAEYDAALKRGLSISGEDKAFFAKGRVDWLTGCLQRLNLRTSAVMDFGCGTGSATPFLLGIEGVGSLVGVDVSARSLEHARREHAGAAASFLLFAEYEPGGTLDLVFCNGVFHHIPPSDRAAALRYIHRALRPGGVFALWENNPWNLGTRYVMSRIPFDRDAITLAPPEARELVKANGFEIASTTFQFIFPSWLCWLRALEPFAANLPLGAQYQVLCRKA